MSSNTPAQGRLFVVSAPSGAGKTTVVDTVIAQTSGVVRSRSYTSRPAREGEEDGVAYHFVSRARFESMIAGDQFLEWAEFGGHLYGTAVLDTDRELEAGHDVVFVIEVQGTRLLRRRRPDVISVFLMPPSAGELERRLRERKQNTEEDIARRLRTACEEVRAYTEYDFVVVNDDLEHCIDDLHSIFVAERSRLASRRRQVEAILASFEAIPGDSDTRKGA